MKVGMQSFWEFSWHSRFDGAFQKGGDVVASKASKRVHRACDELRLASHTVRESLFQMKTRREAIRR